MDSVGALAGRVPDTTATEPPAVEEPLVPTTTTLLPGCDELLSPQTYDSLREDPLIEPLHELAGMHADWAPHAVLLDDEEDRLCLWGEPNTDFSIWYGAGVVDAEEAASAIAALIDGGHVPVPDHRGQRLEHFLEGPYAGNTNPFLFTPDGRLFHASDSETLDHLYERIADLG